MMLKAVLEYAAFGWRVLPLYGKKPDGRLVTNGFKDATTDPELIRHWWKVRPDAGIGWALPEDVLVVDVDVRHDGDNSIRDLERELGELPDTVESETGGGGQHIVFRCDGAKNRTGIRPGIDVKAEGGYIVLPPTMHESGRRYRWRTDFSPVETAIAPLPDAWRALLLPQSENGAHRPALAVMGDIPEGQRNDTLASLAGTMRRRGMTPDAIEAALQAVNQVSCQPPLQADEVARIAASIGRYPPVPAEPIQAECTDPDHAVTVDDFHAFMPTHSYIYVPTREMWPAASVNARIPAINGKKASVWLDQHHAVEQMTWAPGHDLLIPDRLIVDGGWIDWPGVTCFNLYSPPQIEPGDASKAGPWLDHGARVFGDDCDHIIEWLAHRAQRPGEKINHALVLGGLQGIGKDTLLEPVKYAVGPRNFIEVGPCHLLGQFNSFVKSVILRVSEARDLGDVDRYTFYEHLKGYTAAPPDVLRCNEKHLREYSVLNVTGVIITTNHKTDGIYLPADDRRHHVAWSERTKDDFDPGYWARIWGWFQSGGYQHVAAYLLEYDLAGFDPKAPPPKTDAFWAIVDANRAPEDAELADVLDRLANPDAVTLKQLADCADTAFAFWLRDPRNRPQIPHRLETAGYVAVPNPATKDRLWVVGGKRQTIYAKQMPTVRDRHVAANRIMEAGR